MSDIKAIQVMRKICSNPSDISLPVRDNIELYFKFKEHNFSILRRSDQEQRAQYGDHSFYVYPFNKNYTPSDIVDCVNHNFDEVQYVAFHSKDADPSNAKVFSELYDLVLKKIYNIDGIFDEILKDVR